MKRKVSLSKMRAKRKKVRASKKRGKRNKSKTMRLKIEARASGTYSEMVATMMILRKIVMRIKTMMTFKIAIWVSKSEVGKMSTVVEFCVTNRPQPTPMVSNNHLLACLASVAVHLKKPKNSKRCLNGKPGSKSESNLMMGKSALFI